MPVLNVPGHFVPAGQSLAPGKIKGQELSGTAECGRGDASAGGAFRG